MPRGNFETHSARAGDGRWQAFSPLAFDAAQDSGAAFARTPAPESGPAPFIRPLRIFAANHRQFDVAASPEFAALDVMQWLFKNLPLEEYGWRFDKSIITKIDTGLWYVRRLP